MKLPHRVLYLCYFLFILGVFLTSRKSLVGLYLVNVLSIGVLILIIFLNKFLYKPNNISKNIVLFGVILIYVVFAFLNSYDQNNALLVIKIFLLYLFFQFYHIDRFKLIDFLNNTYLIYVILSSIFFYILPNTLNPLITHFTFYVDAKFFTYLIFQSIEGSASSIDSYSGLILLINLLFKQENKMKRYFFIFLSILFIILSLKMTPLVSLVFSALAFFIIRNKYTAVIYLISGLSLFVISIILLLNDPKIFGVPFSLIMYLATHARSMIWAQQITILLENYTIMDYVFGNFSSELFSVRAFQVDGMAKNQFIDNPHSNYLIFFYRMPLMFLLLFLAYLRKLFTNFDRRWFVVIGFIFIACFTNSTIISLQNPVYIILLCYTANLKIHDTETTT